MLRRNVFFLLTALPLFGAALHAQKAPTWLHDKELEYPSRSYIAAVGLGSSKTAAEAQAVSQISMFFKTSTSIRNEVIRKFNDAAQNNTSETGNKLKGNKDDIESKRQYIDATAAVVSKNVIAGFTLSRDFWQKRKYPNGKITTEYLAIYAIGTEDLKRQIDIALGKVEAKTADEREAKEAIRQAVKEAKSLL